ncbi:hypothetical protein [Streptomyces benahoarensis]|uniref:Uncharacterized protein n=1 Tax=Streptomyces benahoarensis TaxID=2595054 RepID=A0A553ZAH3_9ACTN|nr:hypothetical protein [Streptomyces benahoarensis]TSB21163.1 hypothetical protein FNJ62_19770 [Streptomyces benahoarensis]TSB38443.1 hypothetical protein FNZ23_17160 [Streptomyces benahoarensis]
MFTDTGGMIMGDGLDPMQVAAGAAAALVAEMTKKAWGGVRSAMARIFRKGGETVAEQELRLLDAAHLRLNESTEAERADVAKKLEQELLIQLAAFLQKNAETVPELQSLVDESERSGTDIGVRANVHGNTGSQVLIAGRDVSAGNFTYRAPEGKK